MNNVGALLWKQRSSSLPASPYSPSHRNAHEFFIAYPIWWLRVQGSVAKDLSKIGLDLVSQSAIGVARTSEGGRNHAQVFYVGNHSVSNCRCRIYDHVCSARARSDR